MSEAPQQLGRYRLGHLIASGGMGEVFLARSEGPAGFAKQVVIKRILPHLARDPQFVEMFLNEARLAAVLSHPNIVQIFELGEQDGAYFIAMEFIHGRSLRAIKLKLLERKQLFSPVLAARLCAHALQGLHYAHTLTDENGEPLNVVHRDISPDNVLVAFSGQVKLVDFGIAKAANAISTTRTGTIKGKYAYMAPEQLTGAPADGRVDVYAMGVLLYELLTGSRPYSAPTEPALINTILNTRPRPPRERNPSLPDAINDIILRALEKDPAARFGNAEEMSAALENFITSTGQTLTPGHIGAFLRDLFASDLSQPNVGVATPKPRTHPSNPGARTSQVGAKPSSRVSGELPSPSAVVAPVPASAQVHVETLGTPVSKATKDRIHDMATVALPAQADAELRTEAAFSPPAHGAADASSPQRRVESTSVVPKHASAEGLEGATSPRRSQGASSARTFGIAAAIVILVAGASAAAYFAGRSSNPVAPEPQPRAAAVPPPQAEGGVAGSAPGGRTPAADAIPAPPPASPSPEVRAEAMAAEVTPAVATRADEASSSDAENAAAPAVVAAAATQPEPAEEKPAPRPEERKARAGSSAKKAPGKVSLRVNPWAEVFLDGRSLGITPMPPVTVPAGKQVFTLKNGELGITRKVTVMVPAGGQATLKADLFE